MKKLIILCALTLLSAPSFADDADVTQQEAAIEQEAKQPGYEAQLKEKYGLTDEQLKAMRDQGMNNTQITIAAQLAKASGKTIEDVTKMRIEQKMGWGKIAKDLGVHPSEIGKGVSGMRKDMNAERKEARKERKEERRQQRMEKRQEKAERKENKGKG